MNKKLGIIIGVVLVLVAVIAAVFLLKGNKEKEIPKKLASLGFGRRATPAQKTQVVQELRQKHKLEILLSIAQLPRATFYYH